MTAPLQIVLDLRALSCRVPTLDAWLHSTTQDYPCSISAIDADGTLPRQSVAGEPLSPASADLLITVGSGESLPVRVKQRWSIIIGRTHPGDGTKPGMWEILGGEPIIHVAIVREHEDPNRPNTIIKEGWLKVARHSRTQTERNAVQAALRWLPGLIGNVGKQAFPEGTGASMAEPHRRRATSIDRLRYCAILARNRLMKYFRSAFFVEWWHVGYTRDGLEKLLDGSANLVWVNNSRRSEFRADPFPASVTPTSVSICYEYYDWRARKGYLRQMTADNAGRLIADPNMNDVPWHQSYPFLLEHGGKRYCIPESASTGSILLYEYDDTTGALGNPRHLIQDFPGVDSTLLQHGGLWWLFCGLLGDGDSDLYLWFAEDPLGTWHPHPHNPVKSDVRSARPAGNVVSQNGELLRPAQDCSRNYGGAIVLNRIERLSMDEYRETEVGRIEQLDGLRDGVHTINALDGMVVVDAKRECFSTYPLRTYFLIRSRLQAERRDSTPFNTVGSPRPQ